ncbi:hypothetical protein [Candidatus Nitrosotenuis uzonensis]|uniref:Transposase IS4-like domain-containing protein n=1 Tax=Candidatus Nitrosotenuis uzonensis TaxID=1407055 RepID=V6AV91_9ARCH|nr:hypothetical protein [Candidatus Nitrosotenuis uzonensis]CDI06477.1 hypothetical protein NITUZ_60004 [Candidatus Nitrosotenuis uzonensis]
MIFAGADATGFEDRHCTLYYTWRAQIRRSYTKLSASSDMKTQLVCAVVIQHHPISHDVRHFPQMLEWMVTVTTPWIFVLNMGYDAEWVHQMIRQHHILSIIPVRKREDCPIYRIRGRYRKQMRRSFDCITYPSM